MKLCTASLGYIKYITKKYFWKHMHTHKYMYTYINIFKILAMCVLYFDLIFEQSAEKNSVQPQLRWTTQ